ncbi:hypothetical protein IWQ62_004562 [Dispira parvispora]|uniref:Uncharacterized protein n=1 Tax=Dispira parvispora TaxID=1520584 RepID=A0A9W8ASB9_9FUNG|nr:hypothetical protein IWQ62_004562 [Dispira parvispora]
MASSSSTAATTIPNLILVQDIVDNTFYYPVIHYQFDDDPEPPYTFPNDDSVTGVEIGLGPQDHTINYVRSVAGHFQVTDWEYQDNSGGDSTTTNTTHKPSHKVEYRRDSDTSTSGGGGGMTVSVHPTLSRGLHPESSTDNRNGSRRSAVRGNTEGEALYDNNKPLDDEPSLGKNPTDLSRSLMSLQKAALSDGNSLGKPLILKGIFADETIAQKAALGSASYHDAETVSQTIFERDLNTLENSADQTLQHLHSTMDYLARRSNAIQRFLEKDDF